MAWVYIIMGVALLLFVRVHEGTLISPAAIIVTCWCFFPAVASFYPFHLYPFSAELHFCVFLSLFSFLLIYFVNTKDGYRRNNTQECPIVGAANYRVLIILNALIAVWLFRFVIDSWNNIVLNSWANQRVNFVDYFDTTTLVLYDIFVKPLIMCSCSIIAVVIFSGNIKNNIPFIILVLINLAQESVVFAARASIVRAVFCVVFAFLFFGKKKKIGFKQGLLPLLLFALLLGGVAFITKGRNEGSGDSILKTMFMYYMAPFGVLNYYLEHPSFSLLGLDHLLYGGGMFGFIYNLFLMAGYVLFGWEYRGYGTDNVIVDVTKHNVEISPEISMNAACTADYIFMRDFGYIGIVIGFALFAFVLCRIRDAFYRKNTLRTAAIYLFFLYTTMRLSVWHDFLSPSALMTIVLILLFTKNIPTTKPHDKAA